MGKTVFLLLNLLASSYMCDAYKILVISPLLSKSHSYLGDGIVRHLLNAGHEVTYMTGYVERHSHPKLRLVDTSFMAVIMKEAQESINLRSLIDDSNSFMKDLSLFSFIAHMITTSIVEHENIENLLKDKTQHFDLVIAEWMFSELYSGFAAVYNAPLIWFCSTVPDTMLLSVVDEYLNPSYNSFYIDPPFTFTQRLSELWYTIKVVTSREIVGFLQSRVYNRVFAPHIEARGRVAPSFNELKYNASMVLGNSHVSTGVPLRLPQMYKPIAGFHIEEKIKPLPEDLKKLMDNAKNGVIYFSMGSHLQSKDWPEELKRDFISIFGSLNQTVLWKFEEDLPNLPKNIHILHWAPQKSILVHPNCVLFITHGGMLSTIETINAGKPTIGIPVAADQFTNVARAESKGFAKKVELSHSMTEELKAAIQEVLYDPKYAKKAKELSFAFHDRPVKPGVELVHWVEHVIKTGGAPHLRSPALLVPWYQKMYLDLAALIVIIVIVLRRVFKRLLPVILPNRFNNKKKIN